MAGHHRSITPACPASCSSTDVHQGLPHTTMARATVHGRLSPTIPAKRASPSRPPSAPLYEMSTLQSRSSFLPIHASHRPSTGRPIPAEPVCHRPTSRTCPIRFVIPRESGTARAKGKIPWTRTVNQTTGTRALSVPLPAHPHPKTTPCYLLSLARPSSMLATTRLHVPIDVAPSTPAICSDVARDQGFSTGERARPLFAPYMPLPRRDHWVFA